MFQKLRGRGNILVRDDRSIDGVTYQLTLWNSEQVPKRVDGRVDVSTLEAMSLLQDDNDLSLLMEDGRLVRFRLESTTGRISGTLYATADLPRSAPFL